MNDFNSRYRNLDDEPDTIRTNAGGFDFNNGYVGGGFGDDMDIMEAENAQKKKQVARASQARSGASKGRKSKKTQFLVYGIIIAIEVIALVVIWAMYLTYDSKGSGSKKNKSQSESQEGGGSINVDNDNFALNCSKISISADANGAPVAVVYFTFTNKTDTPLSMSQVFSPTFFQNGAQLMEATALAEQPQEIFNKDAQVSSGQSVDCAFAASLSDTTSEITITMRDNYETFSDIGTTVVPIS